jgi:hypothetical protein
LGEYIEKRINENGEKKYIVQFERNYRYFFGNENILSKSEIDIVVLENMNASDLKMVKKPFAIIELKYIRQYRQDLIEQIAAPTEQLFGGLVDIQFAKDALKLGFQQSYALFITDHEAIYNSAIKLRNNQNLIWGFYRGQDISISDVLQKNENENIEKDDYKICWQYVMKYKDENKHILYLKYNLFPANVKIKKQ